MESKPLPPGERRRRAEEAARGRRMLSITIGAVGLIALFSGAIASLLLPGVAQLPFIAVELIGLALVVVSFSRLRRPGTGVPSYLEK